MDMLLALGLSIGVLIAIWTYLSVNVLGLMVWVGIVAWGCFFAAGGKTDGLIKTIAANLSGLVWAFIASFLAARLGGGTAVLSLLVGVVAFMMVMQSKVAQLSFIPGAFIGAAATVGSGAGTDASALLKVAAALIAGAIFGYISEMVAASLAAKRAAATTA